MRVLVLLLVSMIVVSMLPVTVSTDSVQLVYTVRDKWGGNWFFYSNGMIKVSKDGENLTLAIMLAKRVYRFGQLQIATHELDDVERARVSVHEFNNSILVTLGYKQGRVNIWVNFSDVMPRAKLSIELVGIKKKGYTDVVLMPVFDHMDVKKHGKRVKGKHIEFDYDDVYDREKTRNARVAYENYNSVTLNMLSDYVVIDPEIGYSTGSLNWTAYGIDYSGGERLLFRQATGTSGVVISKTPTITFTRPFYVINITVETSGAWGKVINIVDSSGNVVASGGDADYYSVVAQVNKVLYGTYSLQTTPGATWELLSSRTGDGLEYISTNYYGLAEYWPEVTVFGYLFTEGNITKTYVAYSTSNTSYTYVYDSNYNIIYVPGGEEITGGNYTSIQNGYIVMYSNITTTAWNRIYSLTTDKTVYGHNQIINVNVTVVDEYGNPLSGENITVWAGISQYPYNITLTLSNVTLAGGTILATHLYDWSFDGVDDNVVYEWYGYTFYNWTDTGTVATRVRGVLDSLSWDKIVKHVWITDGGFTYSFIMFGEGGATTYDGYYLQIGSGTSTNPQDIAYYPGYVSGALDGFVDITASFSLVVELAWYYENGILIAVKTPVKGSLWGWKAGGFNRVEVARYWQGTVSYVTASLKVNWTDPLYRTINKYDTLYLLDPTFFNGTHYLDLLNDSVVGTPYGGVLRIPAESKWLWVVYNATSDGLVHLRWFPIGSVVRFVNATDGTVVREVFIDSNDVAISLPAGTYNVTAVISYGDYYQQTVTTDANGLAQVNFTAPSYDAYVVIQAEVTGGVKNTTVKVTDIAYSYTFNNITSKGEVETLNLNAWHTLDTSPVEGYFTVRDYWYNTTYVTIVNGTGVWHIPTSKSGKYDFYIYWVNDAENGITKNIDRTEYYSVAGLNTRVESNQQLYAMLNSQLTLNLTAWYDDGYVIYPNTTANVTVQRIYPDHTETNTTTYNITNGSLILQIPVTTENQITVTYNITDFGNYTAIAVWSIPVDAITFENIETIGDYDYSELTAKLKTRSGLVGYYEGALFILDDKPRDNIWEIGVEGNKSLTYLATLETDRVFYNLSDTINLTLQLLNYNASVRTYTIDVVLIQPYKGTIGSIGRYTVTIYANSIGTPTISIPITTDRAGFVYANITVTTSDGETVNYYGILPALIGYSGNYSIMKIIPFSSSDFTDKKLVELTVQDIKPEGTPYFALPIINNVLLTTLDNIYKYNVSELAKVNVTVSVPQDILESNDIARINVTLTSEFPLETTVYIYTNDEAIFYDSKFTVSNNTISLNYTIPKLPLNSLETISITAYVYNNWNNKLVGYDSKTISVFNSPPSIYLVEPQLNAVINGTTNITVYVHDDSGIKNNQILWKTELDEDWRNATLTNSYATLVLDTRKYANGLIRIIVQAEDNHGNVATEIFYFTIDNPEFTSEFWGRWDSIANMLSRYIFIPGVVTGLITMLLGAFITYAIMKLRRKTEVIIVREGGKK